MNIWMISLLMGQGVSPSTPGDLDPLYGAVILDEKAYLLRAPEFIADQVERFAWKDDQLVYIQNNGKTKAAVLWNDGKTANLGEFPATAKISLVTLSAWGAQFGVGSPMGVVVNEGEQTKVVLVGEKLWTQSFPSQGLQVQPTIEGLVIRKGKSGFVWFADGSTLEAPNEPGDLAGNRHASFMRPNGQELFVKDKKWSTDRKDQVSPDRARLAVSRDEAKSGPDTRATWRDEVWLVSEDKETPNRALLHPDAEGSLSPTWKSAAVNIKGSLFARKIIVLPKDAFMKLASAAESHEIMNKAKQVGTAMHIYMADYDDMVAPRDGWKDSVMPYIKDGALMDGFEYTLDRKYKGMMDIEDPSKVEMGRMRGRYGTAIVRGDGSVIWEPRKA